MKPEGILAKPSKVEKLFPSGHFYPILDVSYEEWMEIIDKMRDVDGSSRPQLRPFIHEIYLYSNGENTVADIARMIGFEYGVSIRPEHFLPILEALEKFGAIKLK